MDSTDTFPDWDRIASYLFGTMGVEAHADFERELASNATLAREVATVARGLAATEPEPVSHAARLDAALRRLDAEIVGAAHAPIENTLRRMPAPRAVRLPHWVWGLAGVAAVLLLAIVWRARFVPVVSPVVASTQYVTRNGEYALLTLPDGSRIRMAPSTQLQYAMNEKGHRTVTLQGQAYFTVIPDPAHSFHVRAGSVQAIVLGTEFNVQQYPGERDVRIAVVTGKVQTTVARASRTLAAGMMVYAGDSALRSGTAREAEAAVAWTRGELVFDEVSVSAMLKVLERWSEYRFRLADSALAHQQVTTVLPVHNPAALLRALGDLLEVTVTVDGKLVTLRGRRSAIRRPAPRDREDVHQWSTPREAGR